uniref:Uncharacterized protein n=1 Tax=Oryza punctata TaxID=4537 RepID=A0A0E0MCI7_ORYPU
MCRGRMHLIEFSLNSGRKKRRDREVGCALLGGRFGFAREEGGTNRMHAQLSDTYNATAVIRALIYMVEIGTKKQRFQYDTSRHEAL